MDLRRNSPSLCFLGAYGRNFIGWKTNEALRVDLSSICLSISALGKSPSTSVGLVNSDMAVTNDGMAQILLNKDRQLEAILAVNSDMVSLSERLLFGVGSFRSLLIVPPQLKPTT